MASIFSLAQKGKNQLSQAAVAPLSYKIKLF